MPLPLALLEREGGGLELEKLLARLDETRERSPWLLCAACEQRITDNAARIPIHDQHEHTVSNPHGFVFRIGCFDSAPGVVEDGEPSIYWSWFPGYRWQIVVCQQCRWHLGWRFDNDGDTFFGLVLDRLRLERGF